MRRVFHAILDVTTVLSRESKCFIKVGEEYSREPLRRGVSNAIAFIIFNRRTVGMIGPLGNEESWERALGTVLHVIHLLSAGETVGKGII